MTSPLDFAIAKKNVPLKMRRALLQLVFKRVRADDRAFEAHGAKIVVDAKSLEVLDGSTLDYVKEGLKQVFKFDNPNIDATCGCGESFSVKEKA